MKAFGVASSPAAAVAGGEKPAGRSDMASRSLLDPFATPEEPVRRLAPYAKAGRSRCGWAADQET